jgi:hypothetical protein
VSTFTCDALATDFLASNHNKCHRLDELEQKMFEKEHFERGHTLPSFSESETNSFYNVLNQSRLKKLERHRQESISSGIASNYTNRSRKSIIAFSSEFSQESAAFSIGKSSSEVHEDGISTFLAACLTANYISVGYLLVPWGKNHYALIPSAALASRYFPHNVP